MTIKRFRTRRWLGLALLGALGCELAFSDDERASAPVASVRQSLAVSELGTHDAYHLWQRLAGAAANEVLAQDRFGSSIATGKASLDVFANLVIGAPQDDSRKDDQTPFGNGNTIGNAGAVYIFSGARGGAHTGRLRMQTSNGEADIAEARLGYSVAMGDFNGDQLVDVAAGAPGMPEDGDANVGKVFVWHAVKNAAGPLLNWEASPRPFWSSTLNCGANQLGDEFGFALAAADFNGDGYDDLAIGAPGEDSTNSPTALGAANGKGLVCIALGSSTGLQPGGYYFQDKYGGASVSVGDRHGHSLVAGLLDSGKYADLVVGAPGEDAGAGAVMVWRGKDTQNGADVFTTNEQSLKQQDAGATSEAGDGFGTSLALGNFNGSGGLELAVGAPFDKRGASLNAGLICVFPGGTSSFGAGSWLDQGHASGTGSEPDDHFGSALAAGDFDDDGIDDLAVGVPGDGPASAPKGSGMVILFEGSSTGLLTGSWFKQESGDEISESNDRFGSALAGADFDGDGADDLAIGLPGEGHSADPSGAGLSIVIPGRGNLQLTHGPIVGAVTTSSARLWMRANRPSTARVTIAGCATCTKEVALTNATDGTGIVQIDGLGAGAGYSYSVSLAESGSQQFALKFTGEVRTIPTWGTLTFAVGADLKEAYAPYTIFDRIDANLPHFFMAIGDNVYADAARSTVSSFEAFYRRNWGDRDFRDFMQHTSTQMIWDDHDIHDNWADGTGGKYPSARAAFERYAAALNPPSTFNDDPSGTRPLYYKYTARNVDFFVLDTRTYRNASNHDMLGSTQLEALKHWLTNPSTDAKFRVIVSSSPFHDYATNAEDPWNGLSKPKENCKEHTGQYVSQRQAIFDHISQNNVNGVVLISGDQHWAGMFPFTHTAPGGVTKTFHEFSPTPLGVDPRSLPNCDPPLTSATAVSGGRYFGLFTIDPTVTPATLKYRLIQDVGANATGTVVHCKTVNANGVTLFSGTGTDCSQQ